jgi:FMN reductase
MTRIVALSGSLSRPSRTLALVRTLAERIAQRVDGTVSTLDIAELAPDLGRALSFKDLPESITQAHHTLAQADVLVIGSPVYKGSYSGLLKHFLDLLDPDRIAGRVAVLAATGGSDRHALVIDHQLRPLASFFELNTVPAGIYVRDAEFVHGQPDSDAARARIQHVVGQTVALLRQETLASTA